MSTHKRVYETSCTGFQYQSRRDAQADVVKALGWKGCVSGEMYFSTSYNGQLHKTWSVYETDEQMALDIDNAKAVTITLVIEE